MYRRFTVAEANALLPELKPRVARLRLAWRRLRDARPAMAAIVADRPQGDLGGGILSEAAADTITVHDEVAAIRGLGVVVRDPATGLLDFPAERDGEPIYLCWCHPESSVAFWHTVHGGYSTRLPLGVD